MCPLNWVSLTCLWGGSSNFLLVDFSSCLAILSSLYCTTLYTSGINSHKNTYRCLHFKELFFFFSFSSHGFYGNPFYIDFVLGSFLSNLNNDCFNNVCCGAPLMEAAVATSKVYLFWGRHAYSVCCFKAHILMPASGLKSVRLWCNKGRFLDI